MKRKRLALLLAAALTVTSVDGTVFSVSGADFSSEPVQEEVETQADEGTAEATEEGAEDNSVEDVFDSEVQDTAESGEPAAEDSVTEEDPEAESPEELSQPESETDSEDGAEVQELNPEESDFSAGDDFAAEAEASSSIIPSTVQKLEVNKSYSVNIDEGGKEAWYSFTAPAEGNYVFTSEGDYDTYGYCYDSANVTDKENCLVSDDESGDDSNFCMNIHMTKGKTYYFCAQLYDSDETGSFTVKFTKTTDPTSVQVNTAGIVQKEFKANFEECQVNGLKLTAKYGTGKADQTLTFNGRNSIRDTYGNEFTYKFVEMQGNQETEFWYGVQTLYEGTYKLILLCNGKRISTDTSYAIKVSASKSFTALHVGNDNQIESLEGMYKWYTFTAPATAEYRISPISSLEVREKTEYGWDIVYGDGTEIGADTFSLEKGKVYYLGFSGARQTDDNKTITKWNVSVKAKAQIKSLVFSEKSLVFTAGIDTVGQWTPAGKLTVNYNDGSKADILNVKIGREVTDREGNEIIAKVTDSSGKEVSWLDEDTYDELYLSEGTYKLSYTYQKNGAVVTTGEIPLTVQKKADLNKYPKLVEGKNSVAMCHDSYDSDDPHTWYAFKVGKSGVYTFGYDDDEEREISWRKIDSNGNVQKYDPKWTGKGYKFDAGNYLGSWFCYKDDGQNSETVNIKRIPSVTSVKVKSYSPKDMTFVEKSEIPYLKEVTAVITYDDGTTKEKDLLDSDDEYTGYVNYQFAKSKDKNGKYTYLEPDDNLAAGNYVYRVSVNDVYAADIPVKIVTPDKVVKSTITSSTTSIKNQNKLVLKYKAPADGRYELETNVPVTDFKISAAKDSGPKDCVIENYRFYADLKKGVEYYIYVAADEYCPELKVTVSSVTRPTSMATTALKKNYVAGVDYFSEEDMQTTVNYGKNKSRTVKGSDLVNGYYLHYSVKNSSGKEYEIDEPLSVGTWKVTPYLSASIQTGSAIAVEMSKIPVTSATVTAKKLDLKSVTALKENTWTNIGNTTDTRKQYAFTAPKDGTYTYECDSKANKGYVHFYTDGKQGYVYQGKSVDLKKGETCLVAAYSVADFKIKIKNIAYTGTAEEVKSINLTDGMEKGISYKGKDIPCTFTPGQTGYYVMESSSLNGQFMDTYVTLLCGNEEIAEDDESGESGNFRLIWKLEKGKKYTYLPRLYGSNNGAFKISFHKINVLSVKDVKLVAKKGVKTDQITLLDILENFYDLQVIYENGTSKVIEWGSDKDSYGNSFYSEANRPDSHSDKDKKLNATISVRCTTPGQKEKTIQKQVSVKGVAGLNEIKTGTNYTIGLGYSNYRFVPASDGEYVLTINADDNIKIFSSVSGFERVYDNVWGEKSVRVTDEGEKAYSVYLKAGKTYIIRKYSEDENAVGKTFRIQKAKKTLKGLQLVKAPEKTTCLPNDVNSVSLKGLQVKALYTDGTTETVTYGKADSSGRYIHHNGVKWLDNGKCRAYVALGKYQVSFDLNAESWDKVQTLKTDVKTTLNAVRGDVVTLKFVSRNTGLYQINVDGGYVLREVKASDPTYNSNYIKGYCSLTAGKTYYIHVHATKANPVVTAVCKDCQWKVTTDTKATCTKSGKKVETCQKHGETKETVRPALGHTWNKGVITKKATCKEAGVKTFTCSRCGGKKTESVAKTTEHKWDKGKITKAATCKATGVKTYTCTVCGKTKTETIAKTTEHKWDKGKVTKAATCKEAGVKTYTCTVCGKTKTETIAKTTEHKWDKGKVTKAATCKETGVKTYTCTVCGKTKTEAIAKTTEHKWDKGKVTKAASCKATGVKTYTCMVCRKTKTETIAKTTEHKWDKGKVTKAASCKATGVKTYTCTVCGKTKTETIAKSTKHKFGKWTKVSDATVFAKQKQKRICSICGKTEKRDYGNKLKATIKLNITSITLQQKQTTKAVKVTMAKGDSVKSWTSNNKKVATVDKNGTIKAQKKNGTAKITVTLKSGKKATVTVKVQSKKITTSKITGLKSKVTLKKGKKLTLKPVISPATSQDKITYTTSKNSVATVSSKGVITAKKKGTAKITVKSGKKSYVVTVTVK